MNGAEQRPAGAFTLSASSLDGVSRPVVAAAVPSRLTVRLPLPRHGVFHTMVALAEAPIGVHRAGARLRVGVSDERTRTILGEVKTELFG